MKTILLQTSSYIPNPAKALATLPRLLLAGLLLTGSSAATLADCTPPPDGLVGWWQGNGSAVDAAGTASGVLAGNVSYGAGAVGQGFVLDGAGDAVTVGMHPSFQLQSFTIEGWVKRASATRATWDGLYTMGCILDCSTGGYGFALESDGRLLLTKIEYSGIWSTSLRLTNTTSFHHVAVTKSGSNVVFYVDGVAEAGPAYDPGFVYTNGPMAIGGRGDDLAASFLGTLDEVSIYSRALSLGEVGALFTAGSAGKCFTGTAPAITQQPTNTSAVAGNGASFSAVASGTAPLAYQWFRNGTNALPTGTSDTLSFPAVQTGDAGGYTVVVTNAFGAVTSQVAMLTVLPPPPACAAPADGLVGWWRAEGNAANMVGTNQGTLLGQAGYAAGQVGQGFVFDGSGDAVRLGNPASLQLQDFTIEAWVKRDSTSITTMGWQGTAALVCYGYGGYGFGIRNSGTLFLTTVGTGIVETTNAVTDLNWHHLAVTKFGSAVVFYIDGVVNSAPAYPGSFYFSSEVAIGDRGDEVGSGWDASFLGRMDEVSIYNRPLASAEMQAIYSAGANGKCYNATAPQITAQPADQSVVLGDSASFAVSAAGTPPLSYQWTFAGTNLAGATGSQLVLPSVTAAQAGDYAVIVANASGSVTSRMAVLTLIPVPACTPPPAGMLGWWRADGNAWNAVGTTQGTLQGQTTYGSGRVGQGFVFDGSGDGVMIGSAADYQLQNFTIEAWVKRASATQVSANAGGDGIIISRGGTGYGFGIGPNGSPFLTKVDVSNVTGPALLTDTFWHHLAVTKSNTTVTFYLDGVAAASMNYVVTFAFPNGIAIGSRGDNLAACFLGSIDEPSIYGRPLTAGEVQAIHAAGRSGKCFTGAAPAITQQPANTNAVAGEDAAFTVLASGTPPLAFQWFRDGSNALPTGTSATLSLPVVQPSDAGGYSVVVTNSYGAVTSAVATLTVLPPLPCTNPPAGLVGWWRAANNTLDTAGASHGTLAGNATFATGKVGRAFVFDGSSDAVRLGRPAALQLQNFTIETWLKRASAVSGEGAIFCYGYGGYGMGMDGTGRLYLTRVGIDAVYCTTNLADTAWHHVALTKVGSAVTFYLDGVAYPNATSYTSVFTFSSDVAIGARGDNLASGFYGSLDEVSIYARSLTTIEVQALYAAGSGGKCVVPAAPFLTTQPTSQSVVRGGNVTFSVSAVGITPFSYQWSWNGTNLASATTATLALTNVQFNQAGNYAVTVANAGGSAVSSNALLTVAFPPATVSLVSTNGMSGTPVVVPITILANGNENALGASLSYDPAQLTFVSAAPGPGALDATLFVNTNLLPSGRIGFTIALPTDTALAAGSQEVLLATFVSPVRSTTISPSISFADTPTTRQLVDAFGTPLSANYTAGTVALSASVLEADAAPRPDGDHELLVADWVLLGRYVARLDYPTNASEFQRADSAPRATFGDGAIKVTDWVQAGRYVAGLDPLTVVDGSDVEVPLAPPGRSPKDPTTRRVLVVPNHLVQGTTGMVAIALESLGNENAVAASLSFDPASLAYVSSAKGSASSIATLNVNATQSAAGKLGFALALPTGYAFPAGSRELVRVTFRAVGLAATTNVNLADSPVPRDVSDPAAISLACNYSGADVPIRSAPVLSIQHVGNQLVLGWPGWATNYTLKAAGSVPSTSWTNTTASPVLVNGELRVSVPVPERTLFYRLSRP